MKELTLRYSELNTLSRCAYLYKLAYAEALTQPTKRPALIRGTAFHALMEGHYKSFRADDDAGVPRDLAKARKNAGAYLSAFRRTAEGAAVDDEVVENLRWMFTGYTDFHGIDEDWDQILLVEQRRVVPLVTHRGVRVNLAVTADLVVHHSTFDRVVLVDHKTMSGEDAGKLANKRENQLDPQRLLYTASFTRQGPKKGRIPILGAIHNTVRSDQLKREMIPQERFGRSTVYYGDTELDAAWDEAKNLARDAVEIRLGIGRAKRMYSSPDVRTCGWMCSMLQVHLTARATGRDPVQVALDYGFERANEDNPLIGFIKESA